MRPFEIPESVIAYFQEQQTRAVVDSLLSNLHDPVLPDMDRRKLVDLSEGVLLACQVRADFVNFMAGLWENTFGAAIKGSDFREFFPEDCTISTIWTEKYFWSYVARGADLEQIHFDLTVQIEHRSNEVKLFVWRFDDNDELPPYRPRLRIPDGWKLAQDEDGDPRLEAAVSVPIGDLIANRDPRLAELNKAASAVLGFISGL
ncbi:MAG: hypothetical protein DI616_08775 [Paracoccus denitrificans]|uniref:Uncharacterized protein n=1 Tax=Paracoccus denitrificans TaxID=266 RepID=A0A533I6A6_PARDE|nr:MAG: hypothetical protein DI616_08775 [Paracoccus denitrificans]